MTHALRIELPEQLSGDMLTGLDEIDAQHAYFLRLVKASAELTDATGIPKVNAYVVEVERYMVSHFAFEETLMKVYGYPGMAEHVKQHSSIKKSIERATQVTLPNVAKLRLELMSWLAAHISLDDRQLAAHILKNRPLFLRRESVL